MSEVDIYNSEKKKVGSIDFPQSIDTRENSALLHQVVVAQLANRRLGTSKVKNRHEVSGSTRKIYRQKGTGCARHGDIKAPLFIGGGQAFGPKPRSYEVRLPQKIREGALGAAVLHRKNEGKLWIIEGLEFKEPKTSKAAELFEKFGIAGALVVVEKGLANAVKSIRNLERFKVCGPENLNVVDILHYEHLVLTRTSYEKFMGRFS